MKLPPPRKETHRVPSFTCCAESPTTKSSAESIIMIPRKRWLMFAARKIEQFLGASTMETL